MTTERVKSALRMEPVEAVTAPRTRRSKSVYTDTIQQFVDSDYEQVEIDIEESGIKPTTLRAGLNKAIEELGLDKKVALSIRPSIGKVYLMRTDK